MTGREFLYQECDEKFTEEDLSAEGNAFAQAYYARDSGYLVDYSATLGAALPSLYHVADTWANFDKLAPVIDRRYEAWKSQRRGRWFSFWRRLFAGALLLGLTASVASAQSPPAVDTSGGKTLRDTTLGFELKYPPTWRVGRSTGTLESVLLGEPAQVGTPRVSMQLLVQRDINPRGLSVEQWYADQLQRLKVTPPPPTMRTVIGGRPTIRREMSRPPDKHYDFYTAINASDIFQVSIVQPTAQAQLDRTHEAVLSTITFLP